MTDERFTPSECESAADLEDRLYCNWLAPEIAEALKTLVRRSLAENNPLPTRFSFLCSNGESYKARIHDWEPRTMIIRVETPLVNHNAEVEVAVSY